jgi:hypothetical protein
MFVTATVADRDVRRFPHGTIIHAGDLVVTAGNATRHEIAERLAENGRHWWSIMSELFEGYSCNSSFTPFDAGEANPFVGLTSTACVAECMDMLDDGTNEIVGRLWFFENWALEDPLQELATRGRTVFRFAGSED